MNREWRHDGYVISTEAWTWKHSYLAAGDPVQLPRVVTISLRAAQRFRSCFCIAAAIMPGKRSGVQANVGTPKEAIAAACRRS